MNVYKRTGFICFFAGMLVCATGTTIHAEDLAERIYRAATEMTEAFRKEDSATLLRFTAEPLIRKAGGETALKDRLEKEFAANRKEGPRLISYAFIKPDRIHYSHGMLFALIERKSNWLYEKRPMALRYNLLAVSIDGGATWRFAEASSISEDHFRSLFGFLDAQLFSEFYQYTSDRAGCKKQP